MAVGFTDLRFETLRLLNETNLSVVGEIATGDGATGTAGATFTVSSNEGLVDYLNEGAIEMCRTCCYIAGLDTLAVTSRTTSYASTIVWFPTTARTASGRLTHCGEQELAMYDQDYMTTTGTPAYWYRHGPYDIGVYPVPTTSTNVIISGAAIPTPITIASGTFSFAPDDLLLKALPAYAAAKLALKNFDDPSLVGRSFWKDWYDMTRLTLWQQLDTSLKMPGGIFAVPPVNVSGGK